MRNISHHFSPRRRTSKSRRDPPHFDPTQIYFLLTMMSRRIIGDKRALRLLRCRRESAIFDLLRCERINEKQQQQQQQQQQGNFLRAKRQPISRTHLNAHVSSSGGVAAFTTTRLVSPWSPRHRRNYKSSERKRLIKMLNLCQKR